MDTLNSHRRKSLTDLFGQEFGGEIWTASFSITRRFEESLT